MPGSGGSQRHTEVAVVLMAEFEETGIREGGLVDSEIFHDA
jgi:hypothetical protein